MLRRRLCSPAGANREVIDAFCMRLAIDRQAAEQRLRTCCGSDLPYFRTRDTKGRQLEVLYFAILSLVCRPRDILEIGTGGGTNTRCLSQLFPEARIRTVDLPGGDRDYEALAIRHDLQAGEFSSNIAAPNVEFIECNSFFLSSRLGRQEFDLIFVDGGHAFPTVAWDVMYAYNCLREGGVAVFHDYDRRADSDFTHGNHVRFTLDHVAQLIPEEIVRLPYAGYEPWAKICLMKKGGGF